MAGLTHQVYVRYSDPGAPLMMSALNSDEESIRSSSSSLFFFIIIYFHATDTAIQPFFPIPVPPWIHFLKTRSCIKLN